MKNSTKTIFVLLGAVVLVSIVAILIPRATHAIPTPTSQPLTFSPIEGRIPWSTSCILSTPGLYLPGECQPDTPTPAGYEILIQTITLWCPSLELTSLTGGPPVWITKLVHISGGNYMEWSDQFPAAILSPSGYGFERSAAVTLYQDPGQPLTCSLNVWNVTAVTPPGGQNNITCFLEGYAVALHSGQHPAL